MKTEWNTLKLSTPKLEKNKTQFLFMEGLPNSSNAPINNLVVKSLLSKENNLVIDITLGNREYKRFQGIKKLIESLLPTISNGTLIAKKYKEYLIQVAPKLYNKKNDVVIARIADSIVLAVVRRISRESHHSAILIDGVARFILELIKNKPLSDITFVLRDFDRWDRPSLRIVNRINKLNTKSNINWVAFISYKEEAGVQGNSEFLQKIISSHRAFLEHFKSMQSNSKIVEYGYKTTEDSSLFDLGKENPNADLIEASEELAFQNYERVYLVLTRAFKKSTDKEFKSQIYRLIALADASRGDFKEAYSFLSRAYILTNQVTFKAHLKYLQGLICTKRYYDLNKAESLYREGLRYLQKNKLRKSDKTVLLEKAWLLNGQALIHALRAKNLSGKKVQKEIKDSFSLEIEAYKIAKIGKGPNFSYLRHNLLANITFLLEINRQYNQAIIFWRKAFEHYLAVENPSFELAFNTRLGLLQFKAGKISESLSSLGKAVKACSKLKDPFYEERIYYALGYVQHKTNLFTKSLESFVKGLEITFNMREWTNFFEHLNGALWNSALMKDKKLFMGLHEFGIDVSGDIGVSKYKSLKKKFDSSDLSKVLRKAKIELRVPEPKLSSYIPSVDLEGVPVQDINRYLVDEKRHALNKNIFTKN